MCGTTKINNESSVDVSDKWNPHDGTVSLLIAVPNFMWEELEFTQINWLLAIENFEGLHS